MVRINYSLVTTFTAALMTAAAFSSSVSAASKATIAVDYGKLPLIFEANQGQTDERVKFLVRGPGYRLFLTDSEAVLSLGGKKPLRVRLEGAAPAPRMTGLDRLPGVSNYFIGRDRSKWRTKIPHYAKVGYESVYPGIDLVFYGTGQRQLEYDFMVAPDADPGAIKLAFEGAERLEIGENGDLIVTLSDGEVRFLNPVIYQEADGARQPVAGGYALKDGRVTFDLAAYDPAKALVIDPVLEYSTYLGGTDIEESVHSIAVDGDGNAYIAGRTRSADFPIVGGFQDTCVISEGFSKCHTAFIAKLDATGSNLLYSTYLGGASLETAFGIAVDAIGNAYVAGRIDQSNIMTDDFPTTPGAFQESAISVDDAFFAKLDMTGGLAYGTYLGGSGTETAWDIAVDSMGRAVIGGDTGSEDFPTTAGALDTICGDDIDDTDCNFSVLDAFLAVIDPAGNGTADLVYSTFLGGDGGDRIFGVAVDGADLAYLTGLTGSSDFPTTAGALQGGPMSPNNSAFLTVINPANDGPEGLIYSTYLGGDDGGTIGRDVDVVPGCTSPCRAYLTGDTDADSFPTTPDSVVPFPVANFRTFVTIIDPVASALEYSTFFGGMGGWGIAAGPDGKAYVTGIAAGSIPTRDAIQDENLGHGDAFVAVIDPSGLGLEGGLLFATYLGGSEGELAPAIAVDGSGSVYLAGTTWSQDFPTTSGAFQPELNLAKAPKKKGRPTGSSATGQPDAFIAKIDGPFEGLGLVEPLNAKPVASADFYATNEEETLNVAAPGVLGNDTDFDSISLTVTSHGAADNGAVVVNDDGSFTYAPDVDFSGTDSFTYFISDGQATDSTLVTIEVISVNDAPVAQSDIYRGAVAEVPFTVLAPGVLVNDSDPEGDSIVAVLVLGTANGQLVLASDGGFTYTADVGFSGTDTFTYQANDLLLDSNIATVTLSVNNGTAHIGDLDAATTNLSNMWAAATWVVVHDIAESPVPNATVTVSVDTTDFDPETAVLSCTTRQDGSRCAVGVRVGKKTPSVTITVDMVAGILAYTPKDNHDPDSDSEGTSITVFKP